MYQMGQCQLFLPANQGKSGKPPQTKEKPMRRVIVKHGSRRVVRVLGAVGALGAFWLAAGAPYYG
jgi:hypothetical protein